MREIPLTRGKVALVDDADYALISAFKWFCLSNNYAARERGHRNYGNRLTILMHRFIMGPALGAEVDHINGNTLDNRRSNLRECSHADNSKNRRRSEWRRYKGVVYRHGHKSVYAEIAGHHLGAFDTEIEAAKAYDKAAIEMFGEFAQLNFPDAA